ncbi:hypothetical protein BGZ80_010037 [Entomortierella chlamydospora]|uniref:Adhesion regulating molecule n=1 Tax=Entomortierella chlamydospora TaxID=101097 RepID=A0A9P6T0A8_9FUNG|nr:hypothetical protein BGZ80_010037 [Entomortierella chlamydospora]
MAAAKNPILLEFKAGRCFRVTGTDTVKLVYLEREDGLMHFYWKNRETQEVQEDLILFPGDAEFSFVPQCTTGRVALLRFKSSSQKMFYWLQEASTARDQIILEQVNALIHTEGDEDNEEFLEEDVAMEGVEDETNTATSAAIAASAAGEVAPSAAFAPAAPVSSSSTPGPSGGSSLTTQQMAQLRHLLGGIKVPPGGGSGAAYTQRSNLRLDHILTPGAVAPLLSNPQICEALFPHLPESSARTPEEIQAIVRTPQFSQALVSLSTALESGQLGPLLRQFGLGPNAGDGVEGFLSAIQEQVKKENNK